MPKISVIIPCFNYARFLSEAVESVIRQTCADFEIIIVNDGSTDNAAEVAEGLAKKYSGYKIKIINQENSGLPAARNIGIQAAAGEFILPLDADDMLKPMYLERTLSVLESNPDVGLVYTWSEKFGAETEVLQHGEFTHKNLLIRNGPPATMLFRKSAWEKVGGYNPVMSKGGEDWDIGCGFFEAGYEGILIKEVHFRYRKHGRSMIDDMMNNHAVSMSRNIKLLHPALFEPLAYKIHPSFARAVIRLKSTIRDPFTHFVYVRFPKVHGIFRKIKYSFIK